MIAHAHGRSASQRNGNRHKIPKRSERPILLLLFTVGLIKQSCIGPGPRGSPQVVQALNTVTDFYM